MNMNAHAQSAYSNTSTPVRTHRNSEYAIFAKVTHRLRALDETNASEYPRLAAAVWDNHRLWGALAEDLMSDNNMLPVPMRVQLIGIAEFVRKHSMKVLGGKASVGPLVDINMSIMRGLRGEVEVSP